MCSSLSLSPDPTLTVEAVAAALQTVRDYWVGVAVELGVPDSIHVHLLISASHSTDEEQKKALAEYFISTLPAPSWSTLAGALYYRKEKAALQAVSSHLQREDGTLACGGGWIHVHTVQCMYTQCVLRCAIDTPIKYRTYSVTTLLKLIVTTRGWDLQIHTYTNWHLEPLRMFCSHFHILWS